jgi:hypothetical protein
LFALRQSFSSAPGLSLAGGSSIACTREMASSSRSAAAGARSRRVSVLFNDQAVRFRVTVCSTTLADLTLGKPGMTFGRLLRESVEQLQPGPGAFTLADSEGALW